MTVINNLPFAARAILDFWFLPMNHLQHNCYRCEWFGSSDEFDAEIHKRFESKVEAVLAWDFTEWEATAEVTLAHILLLDQFPRKLFRYTAKAFSGNAQAVSLSTYLVASGRDKNLPPIQRWFAFMPFLHSESMINQERSVALFDGLRREAQQEIFDAAYEYAVRQREMIERFGGFQIGHPPLKYFEIQV